MSTAMLISPKNTYTAVIRIAMDEDSESGFFSCELAIVFIAKEVSSSTEPLPLGTHLLRRLTTVAFAIASKLSVGEDKVTFNR